MDDEPAIATHSKRHKKAAIQTLAPDTHKVLNEILFPQGFLHWSDVIAFGSASKECRAIYLQHRNVAFQPLLNHLDDMISTNRHHARREIMARYNPVTGGANDPYGLQELSRHDPRCQLDYDDLSITEKCQRMVKFISTFVSNVQREFHFDDPSNLQKLPECAGTPDRWIGVFEHRRSTLLLGDHPARRSLALFLSVLFMVKLELKCCMKVDFFDAFLGHGPIRNSSSSSSSSGLSMFAQIVEMLPYRDKDFAKFLRDRIYPPKESLELLGPLLVSKLVVSAPLFQWVSPTGAEPAICRLSSLPTPLEDIDGAARSLLGMSRRNVE